LADRPIGCCKNFKKYSGIGRKGIATGYQKGKKTGVIVDKIISWSGFSRATICHQHIHKSERALPGGVCPDIS